MSKDQHNSTQLSIDVPEPPARPGSVPDFSHISLSGAGEVGRPPVDVKSSEIRDLAYSLVRVLDRFPNLKVYITHGGGYVPYQLGRLNQTNKNLDTHHNKKDLVDYLDNFYFDLELHEVVMRQAILDLVGADRLLYGSNFGGSDAVRHDLTEGLRISDEDLAKIRYKNACELLHFDPAALGRAEAKAA